MDKLTTRTDLVIFRPWLERIASNKELRKIARADDLWIEISGGDVEGRIDELISLCFTSKLPRSTREDVWRRLNWFSNR